MRRVLGIKSALFVSIAFGALVLSACTTNDDYNYICDNGEVIYGDYRAVECDGIYDCDDLSDEIACGSCLSDEISCLIGGVDDCGVMCDSINDCDNSIDEDVVACDY